MFRKVLIANRGEIAVRVIQACAELGVRTVAVYSEADEDALHVRLADEAVVIGAATAAASYLNGDAIIAAARGTGAEAVHPGYGFLSESADFAQACQDAGLVFIGPTPAAMRAMGSKIEAKRLAASLGVPLLTGYDGASQDPRVLTQEADRAGYPLLIKASAGGGGRGMRVVPEAQAFAEALASAKREALAAFGDDAVLLERYVQRPRHVEIQVFGDGHGSLIHLGERECSIQRRHQKVIEESPSPALTSALRAEMCESALRLARAIRYSGAGTVEFLLNEEGRYAFLEMNTRLQVEHGVTELVTGLDLVRLQLLVAAGEPLPVRQEDVQSRGHAIQCRIYAEDATAGFLPSTGMLTRFVPPEGAGVRNDLGVRAGDSVTPFYDPLLAKLLTAGANRPTALDRMAAALHRYEIGGVTTNLPMLLATVQHPEFRAGLSDTGLLERLVLPALASAAPPESVVAVAAVEASAGDSINPWQIPWRATGATQPVTLHHDQTPFTQNLRRIGATRWRVSALDSETAWQVDRRGDRLHVKREGEESINLQSGGRDGTIEIVAQGRAWRFTRAPEPKIESAVRAGGARAGNHAVTAPLTGAVISVVVAPGDSVAARQAMVVLEAMKMEHILRAPLAATVTRIHVQPGDLVQAGALLLELGETAPDMPTSAARPLA